MQRVSYLSDCPITELENLCKQQFPADDAGQKKGALARAQNLHSEFLLPSDLGGQECPPHTKFRLQIKSPGSHPGPHIASWYAAYQVNYNKARLSNLVEWLVRKTTDSNRSG